MFIVARVKGWPQFWGVFYEGGSTRNRKFVDGCHIVTYRDRQQIFSCKDIAQTYADFFNTQIKKVAQSVA